MAFFVLDKDTHSGVLRLPIDGMFATREEALTALSAAVGTGDATVTGQVYVVDLETALPVLVMPSAPAPAEIAEPAAEPVVEDEVEEVLAAETESEPTVEDIEPAADVVSEPEVESAPEIVIEPLDGAEAQSDVPAAADSIDLGVFGAAGGVSLADALKRAATSLEDEGIVAPESISADDFALEEELLASAEGSVIGSPAAAAASASAVAEPMSALADQPAEVLTAPADWPWSNVEAFTEEVVDDEPVPDADDDAAEADTIVDSTLAVVEEPLPVPGFDEGESLITSAPPVGEDAYLPRPVILGDYADAGVGVGAEPEEPVEVTRPAGQDVSMPDAFEQPIVEEASSAPDEVPTVDPFVAALEELSPAPGEPLPEQTAAEIGYEPTGDLDLGAYTCNDCVYSNTCPKVGEVTPAECGTFQWRAS